jgi:NAD(P)-dependent dehydrogenase (short-subunit alcohol dehydrogenase family)
MTADNDIFSMRGKNVLITGASGHLGTSMARAIAQAGAHVLVNGRSYERCDVLVHGLIDAGLSAEPAVFDITDQGAINRYFGSLADRPLHGLINNAYRGGSGSIAHTTAPSYADSYNVTVIAAHNVLAAARPALSAAVTQCGDASVINIASMYGLVSPDQRIYASAQHANPPYYGAAKAALIQWTRYAACELGAHGIRVNAISPGPFPSPGVQSNSHGFVDDLARKVPLGRIGKATEIAGPVLFLASSASSYVNGANIVVDGGWTCW